MKYSVVNLIVSSSIIIIPLFMSCQKDQEIKSVVREGPSPSVSFTYNIDESNPLEVTFINASTDAESFYWQFGDGTSSTESSPVHMFPGTGEYSVVFKAASEAGYTDVDTQTLTVYALATADFNVSAFGHDVAFINNATTYESISWDFGDGSPASDIVSPLHSYAEDGNYEVTLTVKGLAGNEVSAKKTIRISSGNLLKGGDMEAGSAVHWQHWANQNDNPPVFGHMDDRPSGAIGGVLMFPAFATPDQGSINQLIYQPVQVEAGKKYRFSAQVKLPAGPRLYFQVYISDSPDKWIENNSDPETNHFLAMNAWNGWGMESSSVAVDGELGELVSHYGNYGLGAATNGVYTAQQTGTVYIGIQAGSWNGTTNGEPFLVDNVLFAEVID